MMTEDGRPRKRPGQTVTIADVAAATGFSPSAVSRALNKPGRMSEETERLIREAADRLGYQSNPLARALQTGRTRMIALMLSDITNPVYSALIRGAEDATTTEAHTLIFAESHDSPEQEITSVERLIPFVDGVLMVSPRVDDAAILKLAERKPVVVVNRQLDGVPTVIPDIEPGLAQTIDHLHALGHRRIGYVSGPATSWMSVRRWEILIRLAMARQMSIVEIGPNWPTLQGGGGALQRILASGVTAVVTYNDFMAIGLIAACREVDVELPGRLSIVGIDDIFSAGLISPALTTIRTPLDALGATAIRRLIAEVEGKKVRDSPPLKSELVQRSSTAPLIDGSD